MGSYIVLYMGLATWAYHIYSNTPRSLNFRRNRVYRLDSKKEEYITPNITP
jgi:hypothetical protein